MAKRDRGEGKIPEDLLAQSNSLYEQVGRVPEADHAGEFVAIAPDGRTLLGRSAGEAGRKAKAAIGPGDSVFKPGPRVVGKWR